MLTEVEVSAPRSAVEQHTYEWLDRVEASVEAARAALLHPRRGTLTEFTAAMKSALDEQFRLAPTPAMASRLEALKERLTLVRSMLRQGAAFAASRELEAGTVLGYTPRGLERAL
jgi:hypothetical protein